MSPGGVVTEGYLVRYRVAEDNLHVGGTVIVDSVNPLTVTRDTRVAVAERVGDFTVSYGLASPMSHERRNPDCLAGTTEVPGAYAPAGMTEDPRGGILP